MLLNDKKLRNLIQKGLIKDYIDLEKQITPQSFDLSVDSVHEFVDSGKIDFSNKERVISKTKQISWKENKIFLKKGHYKIKANEYLNLPDNIVGIARPRSSLLRCGCTVDTGIWDAGFQGNSEFLLIVGNKGIELKKNARIVSLMFFETKRVENSYNGIYKS